MWSRDSNPSVVHGWSAAELHELLAPDEPAWATEMNLDDRLFAALIEDDRDGNFLAMVERFLAAT